MPSLYSQAQTFRRELLRGDAGALSALSAAYDEIERTLLARLDALAREMSEARARGEAVDDNWLRRSARYQALLRQVREEVGRYAKDATALAEARQRDLAHMGLFHASRLMEAGGVDLSFVKLPTGAVRELVGVLRDGSPLSRLLDGLGEEASRQVRRALVTGLAAGDSPARMARAARAGLALPRWRALRTVRTEGMRAYRESSLRVYAENSDVLDGWRWLSTLSTRTCAACWSLHGKFFSLSTEFFPGHVSCRCTSVPAVKGKTFGARTGAEAFAALSAEEQEKVLGPARFEMYRAGTRLSEFAMLTRNGKWGAAYVTRPVGQIQRRRAA